MSALEPPWLAFARAKIGTREGTGVLNNPTIFGWAKSLGTRILGAVYSSDSVPWCGLFVAECMMSANIAPPPIALRARSWTTWGLSLAARRLAPGAVLVFERLGGGHVGFYVGEDADAYHVLGGNQDNQVSIARIAKSRCIASRWPEGQPVSGQPVHLAASATIPFTPEA